MNKIAVLTAMLLHSIFTFSQSWERLPAIKELPRRFSGYHFSKLPPMLELNGFLFLATTGGVYRSGDQGVSWEYKSKGLNNPGRNNITSICNIGTELFVFTANFELMKSINNGEEWEFVSSIKNSNGYPYYAQILPVKKTLYLMDDFGYGGGDVYRSDKGVDWKIFPENYGMIDEIGATNNFLAINKGDSVVIVDGQETNTFLSTVPRQVFRGSRNSSGLGNILTSFSNRYDTIYTSLNGVVWQSQKSTVSLKNKRFYSKGNNLYAYNGDSILIFKYKDGRWEDSAQIVFSQKDIYYYSSYNLFESSAGLFALLEGQLFFLPNNSKEWVLRGEGIFVENASTIRKFNDLLYLPDASKFKYSYDGVTWIESFPETNSQALKTQVFNSLDFIFMQLNAPDTSYLYKSANGIDWIKEDIAIPKDGYIHITSMNKITYASVSKYVYPNSYRKYYFSNDGGKTFNIVENQDLYLHAYTSEKYLAWLGGKEHISSDGINWVGVSWDSLNPIRYDVRLLGSEKYFYRWANRNEMPGKNYPALFLKSADGISWSEAALTGLPADASFHSITPVNDWLFASFIDGGLYLSTDFGETWESVQYNLPFEVTVDKFYLIGDQLFAGTVSHGLWKTSIPEILVTTTKDLAQTADISFYPNPSRDMITVSGIIHQSPVLIYNSNGQLVKRSEGSEQINISDLPEGLYFAKAFDADKIRSGKFIKR